MLLGTCRVSCFAFCVVYLSCPFSCCNSHLKVFKKTHACSQWNNGTGTLLCWHGTMEQVLRLEYSLCCVFKPRCKRSSLCKDALGLLLQSRNEGHEHFILCRIFLCHPHDDWGVLQQCISKQTESILKILSWCDRNVFFLAIESSIAIVRIFLMVLSSDVQVLKLNSVWFRVTTPNY